MAAHALLGASSAHRWLACPPSARLELEVGTPDAGSPYAEEGTAAHAYAELELSYRLGLITKRQYTSRLKRHKESQWWGPEMEESIDAYAGLILEIVEELREGGKAPAVELEQRVDYSAYVPGGFGTADVAVLGKGVLHVVDLKYGKGVPVDAVDNPQLRLYALGAALEYRAIYGFDTVRMSIIQPRLGADSTDSMALEDLLRWAEEYVTPRARQADAGEGEYNPGEKQCRWCRAKAICRARAEANLKAACEDFTLDALPENPAEVDEAVPQPELLSIEEVAELMPLLPRIEAWAKDVQEWALEQVRDRGVRIPGYKLVEGRSVRKITEPLAAMRALEAEGYAPEDYQRPVDIKPIGELERLLGKARFAELVGKYAFKPAGKPVLVPESDKRPAIDAVARAAADFTDEEA